MEKSAQTGSHYYGNLWDEWMAALHDFVQCYFVLPEKNKTWTRDDGKVFELGKWADYQRKLYHTGRLSVRRITDLETVPGWWWAEPATTWDEMLEILQEYIKSKGCMPQKGTIWLSMKNNIIRSWDIGHWAFCQQRDYKRKILSKMQIAMLESVEGWYWKDPRVANCTNDEWQKHYKALLKFIEIHGQAPGFNTTKASERKLARWISSQRTCYNKKMLLAARAEALEKVPGWSWGTRLRIRFRRSAGKTNKTVE